MCHVCDPAMLVWHENSSAIWKITRVCRRVRSRVGRILGVKIHVVEQRKMEDLIEMLWAETHLMGSISRQQKLFKARGVLHLSLTDIPGSKHNNGNMQMWCLQAYCIVARPTMEVVYHVWISMYNQYCLRGYKCLCTIFGKNKAFISSYSPIPSILFNMQANLEVAR